MDFNTLLKAGFAKCGLAPLDPSAVIERLPTVSSSQEVATHLDNSLVNLLNSKRYGGGEQSRGRGRGRGRATMKLPPGRSYTAPSSSEDESNDQQEIGQGDVHSRRGRGRGRGGGRGGGQVGNVCRGRKTKSTSRSPSLSMSGEGCESLDDPDSSENEENELPDISPVSCSTPFVSSGRPVRRPLREAFVVSNHSNDQETDNTSKEQSDDKDVDDDFQVGQFVVAVYNGQWYIAVVEGEEPENETEGFTLLKYMKRCGENKFLWEEEEEDVLKTNNIDIIRKINPPIPVSNRFLGVEKNVFDEITNIVNQWYCLITFYPTIFGQFIYFHFFS